MTDTSFTRKKGYSSPFSHVYETAFSTPLTGSEITVDNPSDIPVDDDKEHTF